MHAVWQWLIYLARLFPVNILFILSDQFRHDCLGTLGHPVVQTPHLDALAAQGTLFSRTYCPTMACGPARASLFTGYYADTHGMQGNQTTLMPPDLPVLPEYLAQNNYDTALVGKLHLKPMHRDFGFRYMRRHDAPYTNYSSEEAEDSAYLRYLRETAYAEKPSEAVRLFTEDEACQHTDELRFMLGSNFVDEEHHEASWAVRESIPSSSIALSSAPTNPSCARSPGTNSTHPTRSRCHRTSTTEWRTNRSFATRRIWPGASAAMNRVGTRPPIARSSRPTTATWQ